MTAPSKEAVPGCHCEACDPIRMEWIDGHPHSPNMRMIVCATCGNKRCPHATDHRNACTGSNEPGQKGSSWEHYTPPGSATPQQAQGEQPAPEKQVGTIGHVAPPGFGPMTDLFRAALSSAPPPAGAGEGAKPCIHAWNNVDSDGSVWPMEDAICKHCGQRKG